VRSAARSHHHHQHLYIIRGLIPTSTNILTSMRSMQPEACQQHTHSLQDLRAHGSHRCSKARLISSYVFPRRIACCSARWKRLHQHYQSCSSRHRLCQPQAASDQLQLASLQPRRRSSPYLRFLDRLSNPPPLSSRRACLPPQLHKHFALASARCPRAELFCF